MKKHLENLAPVLFFLAIANFAIFWVVAVLIGGDAINGKMENGRYLLANHGELKEVSRTLWLYSYWHTISVFFTHPVGILAMFLLHRSQRKKPT